MAARRVLVVEDDATLARAITRNLTARGYEVVGATTLAQALAALHSSYPAVILLDIDLPDGLGWEVPRAVRASGRAAAVIVMSALRPNARLVDELHIAAVLEKPFPMESLVRLVATYAERQTGAPRGADSPVVSLES